MSSVKPTLSNTIILNTSKDKIYITCAIIAAGAGMAFSLNSVGYLLGFNATNLALYGFIFLVFSANWISGAKPATTQLKYSALMAVPIVSRFIFNMPFLQGLVASMAATTTVYDQLRYIGQIIGIWMLVSVCEEPFRAVELNVLITYLPETVGIRGFDVRLKKLEKAEKWDDLTDMGKIIALAGSTVGWIAYHFLQRPLDFTLYGPYILWLFISGMTMGYVLVKAGMGAATLVHFATNFTA